jgi:hypothetical protein
VYTSPKLVVYSHCARSLRLGRPSSSITSTLRLYTNVTRMGDCVAARFHAVALESAPVFHSGFYTSCFLIPRSFGRLRLVIDTSFWPRSNTSGHEATAVSIMAMMRSPGRAHTSTSGTHAFLFCSLPPAGIIQVVILDWVFQFGGYPLRFCPCR